MTGGATKAARNICAGAVAAIAAWSSYSHMVHVALKFGERPEVAYALPISVDGMLVVASIVMVDDKRRDHRVRPTARLAFTVGVLASIGANIAAADPSVGARVVAAWPAIALLLVVEMLARPPAADPAEVPPPAAEARPAAESTATASAQVPAELSPVAGIDMPPTAAAHLPRISHTEPTVARSIPASDGAGSGLAHPLPIAAPARSPRSEPEVPPAALPPQEPTAVPAAAINVVPPEPPHLRRDDMAARSPEQVRVPAEPHRQIRPPRRQTAAAQRRPAATTRQLARQILEAEPHLSRTEVAARLGVSTRRLREVLATST
ncbi:DUF2637 domain-containing protein [Actinomycetes bacterium KLBMP 9797]